MTPGCNMFAFDITSARTNTIEGEFVRLGGLEAEVEEYGSCLRNFKSWT